MLDARAWAGRSFAHTAAGIKGNDMAELGKTQTAQAALGWNARIATSLMMICAMLASLMVVPLRSAQAAGLSTIETVSLPSTSMQLFDYWGAAQEASDNTPPTSCNAWKSYLTSGINGPSTLNSGGVQGEALKFAKDLKWPPSGCDLSNWGSNATNLSAGDSVKQGIVQAALKDDYPVLNGYGNASLSYLFNRAVEHEGRAHYEVVGANLFKLDGNYLKYNSKENFAAYNTTTSQFDVYNKAAVQTGSNVGQFFPFNTADQVFTNGEANNISVTDASINHYFGLGMLSTFTQPLGGVVGGDDMVFDFSGDDDMWIFIDGALVLDLGGSHAPASGSINFRTGQVTVKGNAGQVITSSSLRQQFSVAGLSPPSGWQGSTFVDGTRHRFSLFYMERGNYQSNLEITTNLNYMPAAHIQKTDITGAPVKTPAGSAASFDLYNTGSDYDITGSQARNIGSFSTDDDGAIAFVDKDTGAQMNFGLYPTSYFVLKETASPPGYALLLNSIHLRFIPISQADGSVIPGSGTLNVVNYYETGVESSFDSWAMPVNSTMYRWCPGESGSAGYNGNTFGRCPAGVQTAFTLSDVKAMKALDGSAGLKAVVVHAPEDHDVDFPDAATQRADPDAAGSWQNTGYHLMNGSSTTGWRMIMPATDISSGQYTAVTTDDEGVLVNNDLSSAKVYDFESYGSTYRVGVTDLPGRITDYNIPNRTELNFDVLYYLDTGNGGEKILLNYNSFSRQRVSDIIIPNTPEIITARKVDADGRPLRNVGFTIFTDKQCAEATQQGSCSSAQTLTGERFTDENGYVSFTAADVLHPYSYGHYYLKETTPPGEGFRSNPYAVALTYSPGGYFADAGSSDISANNAGAGEMYVSRSYDPENVVSVELEMSRIKAPIVGRGQDDPVTSIDELADMRNVTGRLYGLGLGQTAPSTGVFDDSQWMVISDANGRSALPLTYDFTQDACVRELGGVVTGQSCAPAQERGAAWVTDAEGRYTAAEAEGETRLTVDSGYARFAIFPADDAGAPAGWDSASQGEWKDKEITFAYSTQTTIVMRNLPESTTLTVEKWALNGGDGNYHRAGDYDFALYRKADASTPVGATHDAADTLVSSCTTSSVSGADFGRCQVEVNDFGAYFWEETSVPIGSLPENRTSGVFFVTAENAGSAITPLQFYNPRNPGQMHFLKYAENPDDPGDQSMVLAGALFEVWSDTGGGTQGAIAGSCTTGADGTCTVEDLGLGDYLYRECKAPPAFTYVPAADGCSAFASITITPPAQADDASVAFVEVPNTAIPTGLQVGKVGLEGMDPLGGASFGLYRMTGEHPDVVLGSATIASLSYDDLVGTCTTSGPSGNCTVDAPGLGRYYWLEMTPPQGYDINPCPLPMGSGFTTQCPDQFTAIEITTANVGQPRQFAVTTAYDRQTSSGITIHKTALLGGAGLAGARFSLYRLGGAQSEAPATPNASGKDTRIDECITDTNGICTIWQLPWGRYYWVEESAPDGYQLPHTVTSELIVIDADNAGNAALTKQPYEFSNPRNAGSIVIRKYRSTPDGVLTSTPLPGAGFLIYEDSDDSGSFDASQDREVNHCTTSDVHTPSPDGYGTCTVDDLNTSTDPGRRNGYFVVETDAPQGYELPRQAVSPLITLSGDAGDASATYEYAFGNIPKASTVEVKKIDATTGEALAGARFGLLAVDAGGSPYGPILDECTTSGADAATPEFGSCSLAVRDPGDYRYQELAAPQGYVLPDDPYSEVLTITEGGSISTGIAMVDQQQLTALRIRKLGTDNASALAGATFALYRSADASRQPDDLHSSADVKVGECESDSQGICTVDGLHFGSYFWEEVVAPDGYALPKDRTTALITINAHNAGSVMPIVSFNDPVASGRLLIRKFARSSTGAADTTMPLGGATFTLYADSNADEVFDNSVDSALNECQTASASGECSFDRLSPGAYFLVESDPPPGYELPPDPVSPVIILSDLGYDAQGQPQMTSFDYIAVDAPQPSSLMVKKVDADSGEALAGAVFELYKDTSGTGVYDAATVELRGSCATTAAESGMCTVTDLDTGVYFWKEINAPVGYDPPARRVSAAVRVKAPGTNNTATPTVFKDSATLTTLRILKLDRITNSPLPGAQFDLYEAADPSTPPGDTHLPGDVKVGSCTTGTDGICEVAGLGFASYFWEETLAPPLHTLPQDRTSALVNVTPENAGTSIPPLPFINPRNPGSIIIDKREGGAGGNRLGGATYAIFSDDHSPGEFTSDDSQVGECTTAYRTGICRVDDLAVSATGVLYYVKEVAAPLGYELSDTVYPIILTDAEGTVTQLAVDTPRISHLSVLKVDADDRMPLSGASFALVRDLDHNGAIDDGIDTTVASCTTNITQLNPDGRCSVDVDGFGDFLWVETAAPPGYERRDGPLGTVHVEAFNAGAGTDLLIPLAISDRKSPTAVSVRKSDAVSGEGLAGAVFDLNEDSNDNGVLDDGDAFINSCTSGADGLCSVSVGGFARYLFTERSAPQGYAPDRQWVGAVSVDAGNAGSAVASLLLANRQLPSVLTVSKADIEDPQRMLAGATFVLFRYIGTVPPLLPGPDSEREAQRVGACDTGVDGRCSIRDLAFGSYFWKEERAPDGYLLPQDRYSRIIGIGGANAGEADLPIAAYLDHALPGSSIPAVSTTHPDAAPTGITTGGWLASTGIMLAGFTVVTLIICALAVLLGSLSRRRR